MGRHAAQIWRRHGFIVRLNDIPVRIENPVQQPRLPTVREGLLPPEGAAQVGNSDRPRMRKLFCRPSLNRPQCLRAGAIAFPCATWLPFWIVEAAIVSNDVLPGEALDRTPALVNDYGCCRRPAIIRIDDDGPGRGVGLAGMNAPAKASWHAMAAEARAAERASRPAAVLAA